LSLHLNECKLSASRTVAGRLFHTTGPATDAFIHRGVRAGVYYAKELTVTQIAEDADKLHSITRTTYYINYYLNRQHTPA